MKRRRSTPLISTFSSPLSSNLSPPKTPQLKTPKSLSISSKSSKRSLTQTLKTLNSPNSTQIPNWVPLKSPKSLSISSRSSKKSLNRTLKTLNSPNSTQISQWVPLNLPKSELSLPLTFPTGQTFRWKQTGPLQFTGVVKSHLVSLKHLENGDLACHFHGICNEDDAKLDLLDFLNVGICLSDLWEGFAASDERFAALARVLGGARVLRQDPLECLIQFLCSSNNNIGRITRMVDYISSLGEFLGRVEGFDFHEFPSLERLAMVSEKELRDAGFGYRVGRRSPWAGQAVTWAWAAAAWWTWAVDLAHPPGGHVSLVNVSIWPSGKDSDKVEVLRQDILRFSSLSPYPHLTNPKSIHEAFFQKSISAMMHKVFFHSAAFSIY